MSLSREVSPAKGTKGGLWHVASSMWLVACSTWDRPSGLVVLGIRAIGLNQAGLRVGGSRFGRGKHRKAPYSAESTPYR